MTVRPMRPTSCRVRRRVAHQQRRHSPHPLHTDQPTHQHTVHTHLQQHPAQRAADQPLPSPLVRAVRRIAVRRVRITIRIMETTNRRRMSTRDHHPGRMDEFLEWAATNLPKADADEGFKGAYLTVNQEESQ
jgi:hypothetical protein